MTARKLPIEEQRIIDERLEQTRKKLEYVNSQPYIEHWRNLSLVDIEGEEWKDIVGHEGRYQISSHTRVKSFNGRWGKVKILKQQIDSTTLYRHVRLCPDKDKKYIHIAVAEAFVPNPDNLPEVNHVNGVRGDCRVINLEWGTHGHNGLHRHRILNHGSYDHYKGSDSPFSKKVIQMDVNGNVLKIWDGQGDIERECGYLQSVISRCCSGKSVTGISYGYKWKFA